MLTKYFIQFSANAKYCSTVLDKNVSKCSLRAWAIALLAWISAVFSSCKLPKQILLPVSHPAASLFLRGFNRKRAKDDGMDARSLVLSPHLEASAEGRALLPRETWENGWNSCRFLTPVVQKLANAILRIILYPTDRVTGWVIDYIVTDFVRNRMIRIYEKDVFSFVAKTARKKKLWVLQNAVEPMSFWLLVQMLYHWATRYSWVLRPLN